MDVARHRLIDVMERTRAWLAKADNDFVWSSWENAAEALAEFDDLLVRLQSDPPPDPFSMSILFAPTGQIQEVSLSSGWGDEFLQLAEEFDAALAAFYGRV